MDHEFLRFAGEAQDGLNFAKQHLPINHQKIHDPLVPSLAEITTVDKAYNIHIEKDGVTLISLIFLTIYSEHYMANQNFRKVAFTTSRKATNKDVP